MGANFVQSCSSCGQQPEEFRIVAGLGLRCATPHCPVHPAVTARTMAHALAVWNLSQQPPRPAVVTVNIDASEKLRVIKEIVLGLRDGDLALGSPQRDRELRVSDEELQRLKDLILRPSATDRTS